MKLVAFTLLVCCASQAHAVSGVGSNGVRATGLKLPGGASLNGDGVQVGQVDGTRAGKRIVDGGPDTDPNSAAAVKPHEVYAGLSISTTDGERVKAIGPFGEVDHGQMVASIMISTDPNALGVSPNAGLHSAAYGITSITQRDTANTAYYIANRNGGDIPVINMSIGKALDGGETTEGTSHLTNSSTGQRLGKMSFTS